MNKNYNNSNNFKEKIKTVVNLAMLAAFAYVVMAVTRPLPPIVPVPPLKYDPKDIFIIIGGFFYGPLASAAMSVIVSLIEMITVSTTGPIGMIMNIVSTCSFVCPAAAVYRKKRTITGAVMGLVIGVALMVAVMMLWNFLITPLYTRAPREAVAKMLIPTFLPYNLLKGSLNAAVTMLIYKPLSVSLRKLNMLPASGADGTSNQTGKANIGVILISLFAIITCVLLMLVFKGVI